MYLQPFDTCDIIEADEYIVSGYQCEKHNAANHKRRINDDRKAIYKGF